MQAWREVQGRARAHARARVLSYLRKRLNRRNIRFDTFAKNILKNKYQAAC